MISRIWPKSVQTSSSRLFKWPDMSILHSLTWRLFGCTPWNGYYRYFYYLWAWFLSERGSGSFLIAFLLPPPPPPYYQTTAKLHLKTTLKEAHTNTQCCGKMVPRFLNECIFSGKRRKISHACQHGRNRRGRRVSTVVYMKWKKQQHKVFTLFS